MILNHNISKVKVLPEYTAPEIIIIFFPIENMIYTMAIFTLFLNAILYNTKTKKFVIFLYF